MVENDGDHVGLCLEGVDTLLKGKGGHAALDKEAGLGAALFDYLDPLADALGAAILADVGKAVGMQYGSSRLAALHGFLDQLFDGLGILGIGVQPAVIRGRNDN